jgi:hypothetical protein
VPLNFRHDQQENNRVNEVYYDKYIEEAVNIKFLGLQIGKHLNWKNHLDHFVPKFSGACYVVRCMLHISNTDTLKSIYFVYLHS